MRSLFKNLTKGTRRDHRRNQYVAPVAMLVFLVLIGQFFWLSDNREMFTPFAIARFPCDMCAKRGTIRDAGDQQIVKMCPACFGVGSKMVRRFDANDVMCAPCGGMGRLEEDGVWRTCQRCDGRGLHRADDWKRVIPLAPAANRTPSE